MQDVFNKKFNLQKFKSQTESEKKTLLWIKGWKGLTDVVCKSGNVQKKVPYTTHVLTGKIVKIFLLQRRYWEEEKGGKEGNAANSHR